MGSVSQRKLPNGKNCVAVAIGFGHCENRAHSSHMSDSEVRAWHLIDLVYEHTDFQNPACFPAMAWRAPIALRGIQSSILFQAGCQPKGIVQYDDWYSVACRIRSSLPCLDLWLLLNSSLAVSCDVGHCSECFSRTYFSRRNQEVGELTVLFLQHLH